MPPFETHQVRQATDIWLHKGSSWPGKANGSHLSLRQRYWVALQLDTVYITNTPRASHWEKSRLRCRIIHIALELSPDDAHLRVHGGGFYISQVDSKLFVSLGNDCLRADEIKSFLYAVESSHTRNLLSWKVLGMTSSAVVDNDRHDLCGEVELSAALDHPAFLLCMGRILPKRSPCNSQSRARGRRERTDTCTLI